MSKRHIEMDLHPKALFVLEEYKDGEFEIGILETEDSVDPDQFWILDGITDLDALADTLVQIAQEIRCIKS